MKEKIDLIEHEEEKQDKEIKKKIEAEGFFNRLKPYTKPVINSIIGTLVSVLNGAIFPIFGIFIIKMLFALFSTYDMQKLRKDSDIWSLAMFLCAVTSLATVFCQKFLFGIVGENITINMRDKLYSALIKKSVGWFDDRENAPGILNSVLASDVQALNGASTEGAAVILESTFAMIVGIIIGFSYNWKISLVALGCTPFMIAGGAINSKFQTGYSEIDDDAYKDANLLAGDSILNYRTVASLANDDMIVKEYDQMIEGPIKTAFKKAQCIGFWFGFSQFIQNAVFGLLYWAGAMF